MKLSTGKEIYVNNGIIGIGPELDTIYEVYDGEIDTLDDLEDHYTQVLSREERLEIADLMIKRWTDFKAKAEKE